MKKTLEFIALEAFMAKFQYTMQVKIFDSSFMREVLKIMLLLWPVLSVVAQENTLPEDLRQHNLTQFNASLFNPSFSLDRNAPRSIALWSRWQWQMVDADPTTYVLNYTQQFNAQTAGGLGFYQHNTGMLLNTGGVFNYAYAIPLGEDSSLIFGSNLFVYQQELADERLVNGGVLDTGLLMNESNIILEVAPALRIKVKNFNMAMTVENALGFNFTDSDRQGADQIFSASIDNAFPLFFLDELSYLRPMAYVRAVPNADTQYGLTTLFTSPKFWVQGGYNNFYGASGGAGVTLFKKLSIGGLVEFGLDSPAGDEEPSFEMVLSYHFGKQVFEPKEKEEKLSAEERMKLVEERRRLAEEAQERQRLEEEQRLAAARQDSIAKARETQLLAEREQARLDSIAKVLRDQEVAVGKNERYEEVVTADGLDPGFYLIANVFGTERYFKNFMVALRKEGLDPKSFFRSLNKYHYVYLKRYDTMNEARNARDSNFNGKYDNETWIFRVRGQ